MLDSLFLAILKQLTDYTYHTMCMSCTDPTVEVEATILQNAVVLNPHFLVFVHFMKQSKTLRGFHSQRGQIRVVSGDIHPHVVLKHER